MFLSSSVVRLKVFFWEGERGIRGGLGEIEVSSLVKIEIIRGPYFFTRVGPKPFIERSCERVLGRLFRRRGREESGKTWWG